MSVIASYYVGSLPPYMALPSALPQQPYIPTTLLTYPPITMAPPTTITELSPEQASFEWKIRNPL